jgi:hypothetical protein
VMAVRVWRTARDSRGEPGRLLGGAMGKSRGPVKTVRSGIFVQFAHFSRLFHSPQAAFRCFHALLMSFFYNGKLRLVSQALA